MSKLIQFGEQVEGYDIPVLNEREIRAGAGMLFVMMLISIQTVIQTGSFLMLKYGIIIFLTDISLRVFISPRFSPTLILGRLIVRKQVPEYVGAQQKKFAWYIGVVLALTMFVLMVLVNAYSPITGLICLICLIFLFWEAAFGICIGCKVYALIYKEKAQYCPGEICEIQDRQEIQKTSAAQVIIVLGFILFIWVIGIFFHDFFAVPPYDLFGLESHG